MTALLGLYGIPLLILFAEVVLVAIGLKHRKQISWWLRWIPWAIGAVLGSQWVSYRFSPYKGSIQHGYPFLWAWSDHFSDIGWSTVWVIHPVFGETANFLIWGLIPQAVVSLMLILRFGINRRKSTDQESPFPNQPDPLGD